MENAVAAARFLEERLHAGDVILIKGSQNTIRLERAVKALMLRTERAEELLCGRKEWGELICRPHFYVIPERTSGIQSSLGRPSGYETILRLYFVSGPMDIVYCVTSDLAGRVYET